MNIKSKLAVVVTASAACLLSTLANSWAQTDGNAGAEQQVRKVEEERRQAILRNDIKSLDWLMAPEYTRLLYAGRPATSRRPRSSSVPSATPC